MNDEIKTVKSFDLTGLSCPMPIVKVSKAMKELNPGDIIDALTSDPGALTDFPAWAKTSGNDIVDTRPEGENTRFFIKKS
ncbi:MAG: sulfurtransferase TusA family protein [Desulfobacteraceae bacterium]|nr:MAG: sulfurtransferase TusA family protein [Desulfobacteraceae bacterium]